MAIYNSGREIIRSASDCLREKRYSDAVEAAAEAVRRYPEDGDVMLAAAEIYAGARQYRQAVDVVQTVVHALQELKRKVPWQVMLKYGDYMRQSGRADQAVRVYERLVESGLDRDELSVGLAIAYAVSGDLNKAEECLLRVKDEKQAETRFARATVAEKSGNIELARSLLWENLNKTDPHFESIDLWIALHGRNGEAEALRTALSDLVEKFPDCLEFSYGLGAVCHAAGEYKLAIDAYEKALELSPLNSRILHELGVLHRLSGNVSRSMELVSRALDISPNNPGALRTFGMEHKFALGQPELNRVLKTSAHYSSFSKHDQVQLHYAIAKAFDDLGELDVAFEHYAVGGRKRQREVPYSRSKTDRANETLMQYVSGAAVAASDELGCPDDTPVFILGMPRSGTSLLEQIIASHPDTFGAGELKYVGRVVQDMMINGRSINIGEKEPLFPKDTAASWAERGQEFVRYLRTLAPQGAKRIVDKMPGNHNYVGLIRAVLPNATIIHSQRHPLDTCLSNYRILFSEGQAWSYNLSDLAHQYRKYWNLMEFWRNEFPGSMLEVFYEEVVADTEGQARRVIDALGLDWDPNCLDFHKTERVVKTASASQVRKPIYNTSAYRWKKYEAQLAPLAEEIADIVEVYEERVQEALSKMHKN